MTEVLAERSTKRNAFDRHVLGSREEAEIWAIRYYGRELEGVTFHELENPYAR